MGCLKPSNSRLYFGCWEGIWSKKYFDIVRVLKVSASVVLCSFRATVNFSFCATVTSAMWRHAVRWKIIAPIVRALLYSAPEHVCICFVANHLYVSGRLSNSTLYWTAHRLVLDTPASNPGWWTEWKWETNITSCVANAAEPQLQLQRAEPILRIWQYLS